MHTFSFIFFFSSNNFFYFSNLKGINSTPKLWKKLCYLARSRTKDHRTSLLSFWIEKQYLVLGMRVRTFLWLRCFYAQYRMRSAKLRNHLKAIYQYRSYIKALHVICHWERLAATMSNRLVQIAMAPFFVHVEFHATQSGLKVMASNLPSPKSITNNLLVHYCCKSLKG